MTAAAVALADQVDAAVRHIETVIKRSAGPDGPHDAAANPWCQQIASRYAAAAADGSLRVCRHVVATPQPLVAQAWETPPAVRCAPCALVVEPLDPREDMTCDRCRRFDPTGLHSTIFNTGPVLILAGLCDGCAAELGLLTQPRRRWAT